MKKDMDKIIFESRAEIDEIQTALETYAKEHEKKKDDFKVVNLLCGLLDSMYMEW